MFYIFPKWSDLGSQVSGNQVQQPRTGERPPNECSHESVPPFFTGGVLYFGLRWLNKIYLPLTLDWLVSWARIPIRQVVVWKLYSVKVALVTCVAGTCAPAPCRPHLVCVSGVVSRLAGDGRLHVQQRLVAPAYLLDVTAISEPDCSPLLILCAAQTGPNNQK